MNHCYCCGKATTEPLFKDWREVDGNLTKFYVCRKCLDLDGKDFVKKLKQAKGREE